MDALTLLLNRSSQPRLEAPAPSGDALENIMQAALRAPDHACLTPWRFIVCTGKGLDKLGALYEKSAIENGKPQKDIERAVQLPHRAPMVVVAIAKHETEVDELHKMGVPSFNLYFEAGEGLGREALGVLAQKS